MNNETIKNAFEDQVFVEKLFSLETPGEVREALLTKGIELTEEDICAIRDVLVKVENGEISKEQAEQLIELAKEGELSEEALEQVSGGFITFAICGANLIVTGYALAAILGGTAASAAVISGVTVGIIDAVKKRW